MIASGLLRPEYRSLYGAVPDAPTALEQLERSFAGAAPHIDVAKW